MLNISEMTVSHFMQNTRLLHCSKTNQSVLIDPGGEPEILLKKIEDSKSELKEIWLTHSHLDHCGSVAKILAKHKVPLLGHKLEAFMRANVSAVATMYGIPAGFYENCPEPDHYIDEGDKVSIGEYSFDVLFTPGHSPGHVSFYNSAEAILISGDVLFSGSVGRTDLPGGDAKQLMKSIKDKLLILPPATRVLSGHGPETTIGQEIHQNPFLDEQY